MTVRTAPGFSTARVIGVVAAAGAMAAALAACTPNEPVSHAEYTTPAVVTGNQAIPGDLVNADNIPATSGAAGAVALTDKTGKDVGLGSFTTAEHGLKVSVRVNDLEEGEHEVTVVSGTCESSSFGTGTVITGGSLPGVNVGHDGTGATTSNADVLKITDVDGKALVVKDDKETVVACGVITAK
ncbi:MAG: superoxide dismutase family protein [Gordonia sp. (in: high G+C Gram-positive bacteria)]